MVLSPSKHEFVLTSTLSGITPRVAQNERLESWEAVIPLFVRGMHAASGRNFYFYAKNKSY